MTKDFKRLVRERMAKTGESYSIARMRLLRAGTSAAAPPAAPPATPAVPVWSSEWIFDGKDIASEISQSLYDDFVDQVHSGDYRVGYTEFEDLTFRNIDHETGTVEFHVHFTAEHPSAGFDFTGHVQGELAFDTADEDEDDEPDDENAKSELLDSLRVTHADVHFDMGDPD